MKLQLCAFLLVAVMMGCQKSETGKTYTPRVLTDNEDFNQFEKDQKNMLEVIKYTGDDAKPEDSTAENLGVKFRDTTVSISLNPNDKGAPATQFTFAEFLNSQKTALLVQVADHSGLVAPFFLISVKNGRLDVVKISRPSTGAEDKRFTKGLTKIGRSAYLVNNDFVITTVNVKVYEIKRQKPDERIQGLYFMNSPDKKTVVFLVSSSLYQVYYRTGEVYTQPLSGKIPTEPAKVFQWIQNNYTWQTNQKGISFLKPAADDNRIIDMSEFKKS